jgi:hypothetical protein
MGHDQGSDHHERGEGQLQGKVVMAPREAAV